MSPPTLGIRGWTQRGKTALHPHQVLLPWWECSHSGKYLPCHWLSCLREIISVSIREDEDERQWCVSMHVCVCVCVTPWAFGIRVYFKNIPMFKNEPCWNNMGGESCCILWLVVCSSFFNSAMPQGIPQWTNWFCCPGWFLLCSRCTQFISKSYSHPVI